jgi:hypothetical protein
MKGRSRKIKIRGMYGARSAPYYLWRMRTDRLLPPRRTDRLKLSHHTLHGVLTKVDNHGNLCGAGEIH